MLDEAALQAAYQSIGLSAMDGQSADHGRIGAYDRAGRVERDTLAPDEVMKEAYIVAITRIVLRIDDLEIALRSDSEAEALDPMFDDGRPANKNWPADAFFQDHLRSAQDTLILTIRKRNALPLTLGALDHWLHDQSGTEDEAFQAVLVGAHVLDWTTRHPAVHCSLCNRWGNAQDQTLIEWRRNEIAAAECGRGVTAQGFQNRLVRQLRNGIGRRPLHVIIDRRRARVERAAEDEGKTQDVVDLVRIVGSPGTDHRVGPLGDRQFRHDFRYRIGERQDQRITRHLPDHFRFQSARR